MSALEQVPSAMSEPRDDGAARHLPGTPLPSLRLPSTAGGTVDLRTLGHGPAILYVYPATAQPGVPAPSGWDMIPGATGCTAEACAFRDHHTELRQLGAAVFGMSTQSTDVQREAVRRLGLPFPLLSDVGHELAHHIGLPMFTVDGLRFYRRLTLVVREAVVEHVFYPVFPAESHAGEVVQWLRSRAEHG